MASTGERGFFRVGGPVAWSLLLTTIAVAVGTAWLVRSTMDLYLERNVSRMVFNHSLDLLEDVHRSVGEEADTLSQTLAAAPDVPAGDQAYIVVSIAEHRLWYKRGDTVLFETQVATGSGKELTADGRRMRFETPRGRLLVQRKEMDPVWVPPDWHYVETARKKQLRMVQLNRGKSIPVGDGSVITVDGNDVVRKYADGRVEALEASEGREIAVRGMLVVPPYGTNQRKYLGVLGTHRLYLGDGYGLHGTDDPNSIGRSVSHGCVRLRNEDIETLFGMVGVGTPVYIY